jgi:hypothetical protein
MSEQTAVPGALPAPPTPSPLAPARLRDLLLRPSAFFTSPALLKKPELLIAAWIVGVSTAIERMELRLMAAEVVRAGGVSQAMAHGSWPVFWTLALVAGAIHGALVWWIGGWWYRVRLELSGATNPDPRRARAVYTYVNIVEDVPALLTVVVYSFVFTNYAASFESLEWWSAFALIFTVWSFFTSFFGATSAFENISRVKAAIWFVVLPMAFYTIMIGGLAMAVVFLTEQ